MSLIPSFFRRGATITTSELSARIRRIGSKGLPPLDIAPGILQTIQLLDLNDPAYADNPTWFLASDRVLAAAAQFPVVGCVGLFPRTIIDWAIISYGSTGDVVSRYSAATAATKLGFAGTREPSGGLATRSLAGTVTNSAVAVPALTDRVHQLNTIAQTPILIPVGIRLGPAQMLDFVGLTAQSTLIVTFLGREFPE